MDQQPEDMPSTSATLPDGFDPNDERLNETLDAFARNYNLTAQNVKNIIFHVVKNPETFATLIGKNPEAVDSLRMTRSRQKELEKISQAKLGIDELKPMNAPRTFLDVDYGEEDEDDADYQPEQAEGDGEAEEDAFPEEGPHWGELIPSRPPSSLLNNRVVEGDGEISELSATAPAELLTSICDPDYLDFVHACLNNTEEPSSSLMMNDDDEEEYNVFQDMEMGEEEEDEYRIDRTTRIPRWELEALYDDAFLEPPPNIKNLSQRHTTSRRSGEQRRASPTILPPADSLSNDPSHASSLFDAHIHLDELEMSVLKTQMEKHIQLLTQTAVGTYGNESLLPTHNKAQKMIHELNQLGENVTSQASLFCQTHNLLQDAIMSCHEILACESVTLPQGWAGDEQSFEAVNSPNTTTMWIYSRSLALRYPDLLPKCRFSKVDSFHSKFLPSEQMLLAMALYQLQDIKHSNWKKSLGKYSLIANHFLLNKTVTQIRNHLKNTRASTQSTPLHKIILQAENGSFNVHFDLSHLALPNCMEAIPLNWPLRFQPPWLAKLSQLYIEGGVSIVMGEEVKRGGGGDMLNLLQQELSDEELLIQEAPPPTKTVIHLEENSNSNDQFSSEATVVASVEAIPSSSHTPIEVTAASSSKQKTRRRMRMEAGVQALVDADSREGAMRALIEAVNCDLKQRFFMHQDKLREVQALLARDDLSRREIFYEMTAKLGEQHSHAVALISALVPDNDLPPQLAASPKRLAYQKALQMVLEIQVYLSGCSNANTVRNAFKSIKEVLESADPLNGSIVEERLWNRLRQQFGLRDEPLWHLLRRRAGNERFEEKVEDWEYECINMDTLQEQHIPLQFEQIRLPYRPDPRERARLRVRHGRITIEQNNRLKTVHIDIDDSNSNS